MALSQDLSLSEHALTRPDGTQILCATEEEVYAPWVCPGSRPSCARTGARCRLRRKTPCRRCYGDQRPLRSAHALHLERRAGLDPRDGRGRDRARLKVLAVTDHSVSLGIANGLSVERLKEQRAEIDAVQAELGDSLRLLQGAEIEIKADGGLDYADEVLAELDIVVASLHTGLRQPRKQVTERLLNAIRNPNVDIIGHPTGRMIPDREGADLDMDAVLAAAAETGVVLEINANPARLDLDDVYARRAVELGISLAINTDAHAPENFDLRHYGVATARRGWVGPDQVINTWDTDRMLAWLKSR